MKKLENKSIVLVIIIGACVIVSLYVGFIKGEEIVYTHFFYIPVILTGICYHKKAIYAALFLSIVHIFLTYFSPHVITIHNLARCAILMTVAYVIGRISEKRVQGEEEIKREKIFSANIISTIPDALLVLDKDLRIKDANRSFYETFQTEPTQVIGKSIADILDDTDGRLGTELTTLYGTEDTLKDCEIDYESTKLGERVFNIRARGIIGEAAAEEALVVIEDITEEKRTEKALREAEEQFRALFENAIIGLCQTTPDGRILLANPAARADAGVLLLRGTGSTKPGRDRI